MAWSEYESKDRMIAALEQMFPALAESKLDDVTKLAENYHKYKKEYVKLYVNFRSVQRIVFREDCDLTLI